MTTARLLSILPVLVIGLGCSDDKQSSFAGTSSGGSAGAVTSTSTAGSTIAAGGAQVSGGSAAGGAQANSAGGSVASAGAGATAGSTSAPTTAATRCNEATTGELTLTHTASSGQPNSLVGATKIAAGSLTSFDASDLDLEFCFSVVGSVALTSTSGMSVDSASISGGNVNYVNLSGTTRTLESTGESNRYCIVFDVASASEARGVTVSGATAVTYNWRFNAKSVDVGLVFDPRAKNAPELKAVLKGSVAACQVVTP